MMYAVRRVKLVIAEINPIVDHILPAYKNLTVD